MKNDRIYSGIILVAIGAAFLLNNFGYINFHWSNLIHLWPVFLIIGGVNLLLANYHTVWASVIRVLVLVCGLGVILFGNFHYRFFNFPVYSYHFHSDDDDDNDDDSDRENVSANLSNNTYRQPYSNVVKLARLNITGGATSYTLSDTTADLFKASTREYNNAYNLEAHQDDSVQVLDFNMNKHHNGFTWDSNHSNSANIKLNSEPEWEIDVRGGAAKLNFDLTKFKIRTVRLNGGAASYTVKLANNLPVTNVNVSAGVSEIEINVPKSAACDIVTASGLSSTNFVGFNKVGDNHYATAGFSNNQNRIYINLHGGVSEFRVNRY
ncbi:hypothetical protein HH214_17140 [Mucilaginibacter robiniae]|uniref:LiaI-LiaF-like transmembrane region domain-containing protein n=1 Tax=Mucilaginibacter robiniae TaxID=2728022 RepID=A0A7L5E2W8_9SPHI|nr:DUF5668 domain-containing protein [Mucilaginibacter robiniae]QJD97475.1 hypothetical protein HH214_17140 [Mucilaginibacter robiniae]